MSGTQTSTSNTAATPGNWITQTINGMQYDVLLPANYNPAASSGGVRRSQMRHGPRPPAPPPARCQPRPRLLLRSSRQPIIPW